MICGKDCRFLIDGTNVDEGSEYNLDITREENNVTPFNGSEMGDWLACFRSGTVTLKSYKDEGITDGDTVDLVITEGQPVVHTRTMEKAICTAFNTATEAIGILTYNYTFRLVGYVVS